jgi:hypothetical protein
VDGEQMGRAVAGEMRDLAVLTIEEVTTVLHASAFELARRAGQTPRTVAEALFASAPSDEQWRTEILPMVAAFADAG